MCLMLVFMLLYINWLNFFPSPVQSAGNLLGIWLTLFIHWPISDHTDCYFYFYISTYVIRSSVMCSPFLSRFPSPVSLRLLLTSSILCGWGSFWELLLVCLIPIRVRSLSYTWISSAEWSAFICGSFWIASFIDFFFFFATEAKIRLNSLWRIQILMWTCTQKECCRPRITLRLFVKNSHKHRNADWRAQDQRCAEIIVESVKY